MSLYINELTLSWREGIKTVVITLQVITLFVKPIQSLIVWPTCYSLCHTILCIPQRQLIYLVKYLCSRMPFVTGSRVEGLEEIELLCTLARQLCHPSVQCQGQGSWLTIRTFDDQVTSMIVADKEGKITGCDLNPSMMFLPLGH